MAYKSDPDPEINKIVQSSDFQQIRYTQILDYLNSHFKGKKLEHDVIAMIDDLITNNLIGELKNGDGTLTQMLNNNKNNVGEKKEEEEHRHQEPVKTESMQQEPVKTEPLQQEPVKTEPLQQEPVKTVPLQQEPVETEPLQQESVKTESLQQEAVKAESLQQEPVKTESLQQEPVKTESLQQEPVKTESLQQEAVKTESLQQEAVKIESLQQEAVKTEPLQHEAVKTESLQQEPVKTESLQQEPVKTESLQQEPVKTEPLQQEEVKTESIQQEPVKTEPMLQVQEKPMQEQVGAEHHQDPVKTEHLDREPIKSEHSQQEPIKPEILQPSIQGTTTDKQPMEFIVSTANDQIVVTPSFVTQETHNLAMSIVEDSLSSVVSSSILEQITLSKIEALTKIEPSPSSFLQDLPTTQATEASIAQQLPDSGKSDTNVSPSGEDKDSTVGQSIDSVKLKRKNMMRQALKMLHHSHDQHEHHSNNHGDHGHKQTSQGPTEQDKYSKEEHINDSSSGVTRKEESLQAVSDELKSESKESTTTMPDILNNQGKQGDQEDNKQSILEEITAGTTHDILDEKNVSSQTDSSETLENKASEFNIPSISKREQEHDTGSNKADIDSKQMMQQDSSKQPNDRPTLSLDKELNEAVEKDKKEESSGFFAGIYNYFSGGSTEVDQDSESSSSGEPIPATPTPDTIDPKAFPEPTEQVEGNEKEYIDSRVVSEDPQKQKSEASSPENNPPQSDKVLASEESLASTSDSTNVVHTTTTPIHVSAKMSDEVQQTTPLDSIVQQTTKQVDSKASDTVQQTITPIPIIVSKTDGQSSASEADKTFADPSEADKATVPEEKTNVDPTIAQHVAVDSTTQQDIIGEVQESSVKPDEPRGESVDMEHEKAKYKQPGELLNIKLSHAMYS